MPKSPEESLLSPSHSILLALTHSETNQILPYPPTPGGGNLSLPLPSWHRHPGRTSFQTSRDFRSRRQETTASISVFAVSHSWTVPSCPPLQTVLPPLNSLAAALGHPSSKADSQAGHSWARMSWLGMAAIASPLLIWVQVRKD